MTYIETFSSRRVLRTLRYGVTYLLAQHTRRPSNDGYTGVTETQA